MMMFNELPHPSMFSKLKFGSYFFMSSQIFKVNFLREFFSKFANMGNFSSICILYPQAFIKGKKQLNSGGRNALLKHTSI